MTGVSFMNEYPGAGELAALCAEHLRREEMLLAAALPIARAVKEAFASPGIAAFGAALGRHQEFSQLMEEMQLRRRRFQEALAPLLNAKPAAATLAQALVRLPEPTRNILTAGVTRVRQLAGELAALRNTIAIHLRIYVDAYRRILRDLTNTAAGSGRYGPAGITEIQDYRPMIQIHG